MLNRLLNVQQVPTVRNRKKKNFNLSNAIKIRTNATIPINEQSRIASAATLNTIISDSDTTQIDQGYPQAGFGMPFSSESYLDNETTSMLKTIIKISYIDVVDSIRWSVKRLNLELESEEQTNQLNVVLNLCLSTLQQRPRRLLAFINPFGGKGRARRVFEKKALPLFKEARVEVDSIFTERADQARDHVMKEDLNNYDGIICVGGDGMFAEISNGLLIRINSEANININDPEVNIVPVKLRIGIIPAGSTDAIVYGTTGLNDPITSTLQIITGESLLIDSATVHNEKGFVRIMTAMLAYGFFGDIIQLSDKWRCLGPFRYDLAGFYQFLRNRSYNCELKINQSTNNSLHTIDSQNYRSINDTNNVTELLDSIDSQQTLNDNNIKINGKKQTDSSLNVIERIVKPALVFCKRNCEKCSSLENVLTETDLSLYTKREGRYITINCLNMPCRTAKSKFGIAPFVHLGDGSFDLILVKRSSHRNFLRFLLRIAKDGRSIEELPNVERFCVNDVLISPVISDRRQFGNWQVDGELVNGNEMRIRTHRQVLSLFASGIPIDKVGDCIPKKKEAALSKLCSCLRRKKDKK